MRRFAGPVAFLVVFLAMSRWVPSRTACPSDPRSASTSAAILPDAASASIESATPPRRDTLAPDPFALAPIPVASARPGPSRPSGPAPSRPWVVTGLVGARAAVLMKPDGSSAVVSVGQRIDSAVVVGISAAGVELEDRGGRVILKVRR